MLVGILAGLTSILLGVIFFGICCGVAAFQNFADEEVKPKRRLTP